MGNQILKDSILEILGSDGSLSVSQLATKLVCSNQIVMETVDEMDDQGLVVSSVEGTAVKYSLTNQADAKRPEKEVFKPSQAKTMVEVGVGGKLATVKLMVIEALNDVPNQTMTRAQLLTALKTVPAAVLDNCLQKMKTDKSLHSVGREVFKLGPMPVNQAVENIEEILEVAIPQPGEVALDNEVKHINKTVEEKITVPNECTEAVYALEQKVTFGLFDDGSMVLKLGGGADLTLSPIEAQRAHKLLNLFYGATQA